MKFIKAYLAVIDSRHLLHEFLYGIYDGKFHEFIDSLIVLVKKYQKSLKNKIINCQYYELENNQITDRLNLFIYDHSFVKEQ